MCIIATNLDLNIFSQKHSTKDISYHSLSKPTFSQKHSLMFILCRLCRRAKLPRDHMSGSFQFNSGEEKQVSL